MFYVLKKSWIFKFHFRTLIRIVTPAVEPLHLLLLVEWWPGIGVPYVLGRSFHCCVTRLFRVTQRPLEFTTGTRPAASPIQSAYDRFQSLKFKKVSTRVNILIGARIDGGGDPQCVHCCVSVELLASVHPVGRGSINNSRVDFQSAAIIV